MEILEMKNLVESNGIKWITFIRLSPKSKQRLLRQFNGNNEIQQS